MKRRLRKGLLYGLLLIVPILVIGANFKVDEGDIRYMSAVTEKGYQRDFFSFFRMLFLAGIAPLVFLFSIERRKNIKYLLLFIVLFIFQILSYLLSPLKAISLWGISGRYEGILAWGSYMLIAISFLFGKNNKKELEKVLKVLFVGSIPVWIIGGYQFFGKNPLLTETGQKIITFLIEAPFREISGRFGMFRSYGTLGNPNYMGSYAAMLIFVCLYFVFRNKNRLYLAGGCILYAAILFNLLGSRSRGGTLASIGTFLLALVVFRKNLVKDMNRIAGLVIITLGVWLGVNHISSGLVGQRMDITSGNLVNVVDIKEGKGYLEVIGKKDNLYIKRSKESIDFFDSDKKQLETYVDDGRLRVRDERYKSFSFMRSREVPNLYLLLNEDGLNYEFIAEGERFYTLDHRNNVVEIPDLRRVKLFDGYEKKGSSRIYIWTRTIPLLMKRPFLGWGPDTYSLVFPQADYFGKVRSYGTKNMLIDKPHNLYLQIIMSFGILGFTAFSILIGSYIFDSFKVYYNKRFRGDIEYMGFFIFLGCVAYLMAGMFNDSVVCVAPFFWILLSLGICINKKIKRNF